MDAARSALGCGRGDTGYASTSYRFDPRGNVAQRLDSSVNVLSSHFSGAIGAEHDQPSGPKAAPFGFGAQWGYYTDSETNLVLLTNRYYDPARARFVARDPIGLARGTVHRELVLMGQRPVYYSQGRSQG
jgi:RHS repeat-associated protein